MGEEAASYGRDERRVGERRRLPITRAPGGTDLALALCVGVGVGEGGGRICA